MKVALRFIYVLALVVIIAGWGSVGHKLINLKTTNYFPASMNYFKSWSSSLSTHAPDADTRKNSDKTEGMKHYIDIDTYSEFKTNGFINQDYNQNVTLHGASFVTGNGILPWAILRTIDSLQLAFQNRDWNKAILKAADLGHYVGDGHMPLHITENFDGQLSNQSGVHSRYESTMISAYSTSIPFTPDTAEYISDKSNYVFNFIYGNYKYVDSVLLADKTAAAFAGSTSGTTYNAKLWELTKGFTIMLFNNASKRLSDLIYTAWVDAGSPDPSVSAVKDFISPADFYLFQNYPNPFNPVTSIKYQIPVNSQVTLRIYDMLGKEVSVLINGIQQPGLHEVSFNGLNLSSGTYIYRLETPYYKESRKLLLIK